MKMESILTCCATGNGSFGNMPVRFLKSEESRETGSEEGGVPKEGNRPDAEDRRIADDETRPSSGLLSPVRAAHP